MRQESHQKGNMALSIFNYLKAPSIYYPTFFNKLKEALETVLDDSLIRFLNRRELDFR